MMPSYVSGAAPTYNAPMMPMPPGYSSVYSMPPGYSSASSMPSTGFSGSFVSTSNNIACRPQCCCAAGPISATELSADEFQLSGSVSGGGCFGQSTLQGDFTKTSERSGTYSTNTPSGSITVTATLSPDGNILTLNDNHNCRTEARRSSSSSSASPASSSPPSLW